MESSSKRAASQARERELREALGGLCHAISKACDYDPSTRVGAALEMSEAILARPVDDSALREFGTNVGLAVAAHIDSGADLPLAGSEVERIVSRLLGGGK